MTTQHSSLTGAELHEPKGVASASSGTVYLADGLGSGSWVTPYTCGIEDYNDTGSSQALTSGSYVDLTNDGLGAFTNTANKLPGYSSIWDTVNNQFDWSGAGLALGDTIDIRFDLSITSSTSNDGFSLALDMAHGSVDEYPLIVDQRNIDTASTQRVVRFISLYMGNAATLNNPAKVSMYADTSGDSVVVNGWYVRVIPRKPVFA